MRRWILIRDMKFFNDEQRDYFILSKDSVFTEVPFQHQIYQVRRAVSRRNNHNKKHIVLNAQGKQRVFAIGKDVIPVSQSRIPVRPIK